MSQFFVNEKGESLKTKEELLKHPQVVAGLKMMETENPEARKKFYEQMFLGKMEKCPLQKREQIEKAPLMQRNHMDVYISLANSDIEVEKIKAKVMMVIIRPW